MDLRSGQPFSLLKNGLLASYPPISADQRCDVAIIGGGITGALLAYRLTRAGVGVVVLDKRDIGMGSTAASTSLLQYEIDAELHNLIEMVGEEHAVRAYRLGVEAIDALERIISELGDDCDFERKTSLYLASDESDLARLQKEYACRREHGFQVEYWDRARIAESCSFEAAGAILSCDDAQVDAFRLTHRLMQQAIAAGARVYDRSEVTEVTATSEGVKLETERGPSVHAKQVVFATGYESQRYLKQKIGELKSTYCVVTEPLAEFAGWPERCLIWETSRPYFYARGTKDGRAIFGGEDTIFSSDHSRDRLLAKKTKRSCARFMEMFPESKAEISYAWAGTFGETKDALAYIGRSPEWENAYFALGYGGNGVTYSAIAADIITDLCLGKENSDAAVFRFDR